MLRLTTDFHQNLPAPVRAERDNSRRFASICQAVFSEYPDPYSWRNNAVQYNLSDYLQHKECLLPDDSRKCLYISEDLPEPGRNNMIFQYSWILYRNTQYKDVLRLLYQGQLRSAYEDSHHSLCNADVRKRQVYPDGTVAMQSVFLCVVTVMIRKDGGVPRCSDHPLFPEQHNLLQ